MKTNPLTTTRPLALVPGLLGTALVLFPLDPVSALPRTWIGGNADWDSTSTNWNPNDEPDPDDEAIFNTPNQVDLALTNTIMALTMSGGIDLNLDGFTLVANGGPTSITGASTNVFVPSGSTLDIDDTTVSGNADLRLTGGSLYMAETPAEALLLMNSTVGGFGTMTFGDGHSTANLTVLSNSSGGNLRAQTFDLLGTQAGTLQIILSDPDSRVDLDNGGVVTIGRNDTLDIDGAAHDAAVDAYSGIMNLFDGATIDMSNPWSQNSGTIEIDTNGVIVGTSGAPAKMVGGAFSQSGGTINLADEFDRLQFDTTYDGTGGAIANNGEIIFNANATVGTGVDFTMPGSASSLTVNAGVSVVINDENFNLDGGGFTSTNILTINSGGLLDVNHNDVGADDNVGMTINLEGGTLAVTNAADGLPWQIGSSSPVNANSGTSTINGDELQLYSGNINVAAGAVLSVATSLGPITAASTNIDVGAGGVATMGSGVDYNGGTYTGTGTLRNSGSSVVVADTTIGIGIFDWDGTGTGSAHTINDGVTLTVDSPQIEAIGEQTMSDPTSLIGNGSSMVVNGPAEWIQDTHPIHANTTQVGSVAIGGVSRFVLRSTLNVDGGTAINAPFTLDGGTISIDTGFNLDINSAAGETILDGGTITGLGSWEANDAMLVTDDSTVDVATINYDDTNWTIDSGALLTINVVDPDSNGGATNNLGNTTTLNSGSMSFNTGDVASVFTFSTINLNNTTGTIPSWMGEKIELGDDAGTADSDLNIGGSGVSQFSAPIDFNSDADVFIDAGTTLRTGTTVFEPVNAGINGEFTGTGTWQLGGTNNVNEATTINMTGGTVDLDNSYFIGTPLFANDTNLNALLTINAATMANYGKEGDFLGTPNFSDLRIADLGRLTVNLDNANDEWTVNSVGIVRYNGNAIANVFLAGSDLNMNGTLHVTGDGRSNARMDIGGIVNVLTVGEQFRLNGGSIGDPNTLNGGTINGPGVLGIDNSRALAGNGTINAEIIALSSAELIALGGLLDVNGVISDMGTLRSNGATAVLDLANPFDSSVTSNGISLDGGRIQGADITLSTRNLRGNGLVLSSVDNNNTIVAQGGTLRIGNGGFSDLDGSGEAGILHAQTGNLVLDSGFGGFDGTVQADSGREVFSDGSNLSFNPSSVINLNGGAYRSNVSTTFGGSINANSGTSALRIAGTASIGAASTITLTGNLRLENTNTTVPAGTTITGGGQLINASGSTLTLLDGLGLGGTVELVNSGNLVLGSSPGQASATFFTQTGTGTMNIEIAGTGFANVDSLSLTTAAQLEGTLNLSLLGGFTPTLGQTWTILTALSRTGEFDTVVQPPTMPTGLVFDVIYNPTNVQIEVVAASAFEDWIDSFVSLVNPADKTKTADPDKDGMDNFTEFALDGDPTTGVASGKYVGKIALVGGVDVMTLTFPVRNGAVVTGPAGGELTLEQATDGVIYNVQASDDLVVFTLNVTEVTGADATAIQAGLPGLSSPDWVYRSFRSPGPVAGDPREFMRVDITE